MGFYICWLESEFFFAYSKSRTCYAQAYEIENMLFEKKRLKLQYNLEDISSSLLHFSIPSMYISIIPSCIVSPIGGVIIFNNFQGQQGQKCPGMGSQYTHSPGILIKALDNWGPGNDTDEASKGINHIIQEK